MTPADSVQHKDCVNGELLNDFCSLLFLLSLSLVQLAISYYAHYLVLSKSENYNFYDLDII